MTNNYYLANREKRIEYQREYRRRSKNLDTKNMKIVRKKYKKKPIPKTEILKTQTTIFFD